MVLIKRTQGAVAAVRMPASIVQPQSNQSQSVLAPTLITTELVVNGVLASTGEIQIDGQVEGDVTCACLVVGETGSVNGNVTASTVHVRGRAKGEIRARKIQLGPQSHVECTLLHETLVVATGAHFEGTCQRSINSPSEELGEKSTSETVSALQDVPQAALVGTEAADPAELESIVPLLPEDPALGLAQQGQHAIN